MARTRKTIFDAPDGTRVESEIPLNFTPTGEAVYDAPAGDSTSQDQLDYWNEILRTTDDPEVRDEALSSIDQALNSLYDTGAANQIPTNLNPQNQQLYDTMIAEINGVQTAIGDLERYQTRTEQEEQYKQAQLEKYKQRLLDAQERYQTAFHTTYDPNLGMPGNSRPSIESMTDAAERIGGAKSALFGSTVMPAFDALNGALGNSTSTYANTAASMAQSGDTYKAALDSILNQAYANSDSANAADKSALNNFMGETNALMGMRQGAGWGSDVASQTAGTFANANDVATQLEALDYLRQEARTGGSDQRDALGELKREASEGGALQRDVYNKFAALTDPTITAKERAVFDATQQASDARQRSNREAVMDELARRGLRTGAGVIANMQAGAQQDAASRNQALLGLDAMAIDRAMQALAGSGTAANALRNSDQTALARVFDAASGIRSADQAADARFFDAAAGTRQQGWSEALARSTAADAMAQFNKSGSQAASQWQDKVAMDEASRVGTLANQRFGANIGVNQTAYGRTNDTLNRGAETASTAYNTDKDTAGWNVLAADKGVANATTGLEASYGVTKGQSDIWDATFNKINSLINEGKSQEDEDKLLNS